MRILLTGLRGKIRDAVRAWLLGEEIKSIAAIAYQTNWMADAAITYGKALVEIRDGLAALRDSEERHYRDRLKAEEILITTLSKEFGSIQAARIEWKVEQKKRYDDLLGTQQEIEQRIDRLLALIEPKAARLRAGSPPVQDWDEVQRQNLKQFEETGNGVRR